MTLRQRPAPRVKVSLETNHKYCRSEDSHPLDTFNDLDETSYRPVQTQKIDKSLKESKNEDSHVLISHGESQDASGSEMELTPDSPSKDNQNGGADAAGLDPGDTYDSSDDHYPQFLMRRLLEYHMGGQPVDEVYDRRFGDFLDHTALPETMETLHSLELKNAIKILERRNTNYSTTEKDELDERSKAPEVKILLDRSPLSIPRVRMVVVLLYYGMHGLIMRLIEKWNKEV